MLGLFDLQGILQNPTWWLVFVLLLVFFLLRVVTDTREEIKVVQEEAKHQVKEPFLQRLIELNNIRQLRRMRDAFRRAAGGAGQKGSGRFDLELQKEIDKIRSAANPEDGLAEEADLDAPGDAAARQFYDDDGVEN